MDILKKRGIKLVNKEVEGFNYKCSNGVDPDAGFIVEYRHIDTINEIIDDIDKALSGNYDLMTNNDISTDGGGIAFITPNGIEFYDEDGINVLPPVCPLDEFKDLLIAWRDFLNMPPYNGQKVN
ncbi:hypothetical protein ABS768_14405 [Flavobacterium sp. ST-75]|uniref:Uncharacterized protein n=1 Tax=Flavobacterium rhizophilum TaxID=3163296 RepID=A0ABW8YHC5_9FLAO